jgi:hypothetical protein
MAVDRSNFLLIAGTLAAGGIVGWGLRSNAPPRTPAPTAEPAKEPARVHAAVPEAPVDVAVVESTAAATAACDDSVGIPEECPSVGPSDEGVCANVILKRCTDFKAAFKPKVAQAAVSCLRQLKANERCDVTRINQCGHAALMAACPEPAPPTKATLHPATATTPASVTLSPDPAAPASPLSKLCEGILKACPGPSLAPTASDCRQTLVGMNESGRAATAECVAAHCSDRGLLGCEAAPRAPTALVH